MNCSSKMFFLQNSYLVDVLVGSSEVLFLHGICSTLFALYSTSFGLGFSFSPCHQYTSKYLGVVATLQGTALP